MSKQLYEEALADVKKVTEVAEDNAKRAILEVVTPRIRDLIERELLKEHGPGVDDEEMLFDEHPAAPAAMPGASVPFGAITAPDAQGKVTLDLDAVTCEEPGSPVEPPMFGEPPPVHGDEYELSLESIEALKPVVAATKFSAVKKMERRIANLAESIAKFKGASRLIRETVGFSEQIALMISRVDDMYDYVQESVTDAAKRGAFEVQLEAHFQELRKLQEQTMQKTLKNLIKEDDAAPVPAPEAEEAPAPGGELTLKLTGLPADVDLDSIGVDLVSGEEEVDASPESPDAGGEEDMNLDDLNLGGAGGEEEGANQMESLNLSDDTIVEIDENMLRSEIARMKKLREGNVPSEEGGHGVDAAQMEDFGGGSDDGDAFLDGEVTTGGAEPLGEAEEMDESDSVVESDEPMDESMEEVDEAVDSHVSAESVERRASFEKRIQERAKAKAQSLKNEAVKASPARKAEIKKEYASVAKRFNESLARSKKLVESTKQSASLNGSAKSPAEPKAVTTLRNQLAEQNLLNTKLVYANKLLQNESLSKRQKAQVIEKLDEARTLREVKLVYESLVKALGTPKSTIKENRAPVLGSASRPMRPASTQTLTEGFETDRWATLAGITK